MDKDCCSFFPDYVIGVGWIRPCCKLHDVGYGLAQTPEERKEEDQALRDCILRFRVNKPLWNKSWVWTVAHAVYLGVRLFGWLHTSYRTDPITGTVRSITQAIKKQLGIKS